RKARSRSEWVARKCRSRAYSPAPCNACATTWSSRFGLLLVGSAPKRSLLVEEWPEIENRRRHGSAPRTRSARTDRSPQSDRPRRALSVVGVRLPPIGPPRLSTAPGCGRGLGEDRPHEAEPVD